MKARSKRAVCLERTAQLFALTGLAISTPLLNILKDGPEFFVNRRALPFDIAVTVAVIVVVPPLVLLLIEAIARLCGRAASALAHYMFIATLVGVVCVSLLTRNAAMSWMPALILAGFSGAVVSVIVSRSAAARAWLSLLSALTVISVVSFSRSEGVMSLLSPHSAREVDGFSKTSETPVVVLIFDEFPLNGLLNQDLEIDAERFPNFSALAKESTWFRRAAAVNQFTPIALPAILSGKMPRSTKQLPTAETYPANLFTVLSRSHSVTAYEPFTKLCPEEVCPKGKRRESRQDRLRFIVSDLMAVFLNYVVPSDLDIGIPDIDGKWGDFWSDVEADWDAPNFSRTGRVEDFQRFVKSLKPTSKPALIFAHIILPHMPHQFVPSGKMYPAGIVGGYVKDRWVNDPAIIQIGYQQFVLQLGTADRVLGWFVDRLKEIGVYDKAVVVVVADHGASFQPETYRRGNVTHPAFYEDVMSIPLFIKRPGSREGSVSDQPAQTIDVLPTILDLLGLGYKITFDGVPLLSDGVVPREKQELLVGRIPGEKGSGEQNQDVAGQVVAFAPPERYPRATVDWKYSLPGYSTPNSHNPYYIGLYSELLGKKVSEAVVTKSKATFELRSRRQKKARSPSDAVNYDPRSGVCPCSLQGVIRGGNIAPGDEVAVAVNGSLEGFGKLLPSEARDEGRFAFFVLDTVFAPGKNKVELFKVESARRDILQLQSIAPLQ